MDNIDMNKLMNMISNMDKKELEKGLAKASEILKSKSKDKKQEKEKEELEYGDDIIKTRAYVEDGEIILE